MFLFIIHNIYINVRMRIENSKLFLKVLKGHIWCDKDLH